MAFDYGIDYEYTPVAKEVKEYCGTGKRTLLLDADFICYLVGFCSDQVTYLAFKNQLNPFESEEWLDRVHHAKQTIAAAVEFADCDSVILFLTDSANNFRLDIAKSEVYKGQREEEKPPFFHEMKQWLSEQPNARMSINCEADDEICIEAWKRIKLLESDGVPLSQREYEVFSDFVISSQDKDLDMIPSLHCHPTTGEKYWSSILGELKPKWGTKEVNDYVYWNLVKGEPTDPDTKGVEFDTFTRGKNKGKLKTKRVCLGKKESQYLKKLNGTGLHFFYAQLLMGDTVDNYNGIEGIGGTGAYELLNDSKSEQELFDKVVEKYKEAKGDDWFEYLLEQGQLAWMQTYRGELWHPKERGLKW
jgi:hypothetical protein